MTKATEFPTHSPDRDSDDGVRRPWTWADVLRFEDASLSSGVGTSQQCRIITAAGVEWGFLANWVAQYGRLVEVLHQKVVERPVMQTPIDSGGAG
ncbi:MAG TPA: hypothetical protein VG122_05295 [Gemmata sp.]|nr:hypothetical protein [Gemmata sp.]